MQVFVMALVFVNGKTDLIEKVIQTLCLVLSSCQAVS